MPEGNIIPVNFSHPPMQQEPKHPYYLVRPHFFEAVVHPSDGTVRIKTQCSLCMSVSEPITINTRDLFRWHFEGVFAQDAFPDITEDERELLITGLDDCFPGDEYDA